MAKPRVFVSSTYYDLRHVRNSLETFIATMGYEPVLFESGDIAFRHDSPLIESCYAEVQKCHMLVLVIGGRYGSSADGQRLPKPTEDLAKQYEIYNSVTKNEYIKARERNIPIFIFVEKGVKGEFETFKRNRENKDIKYAHVDSTNVFLLLDDILSQTQNNFVREFDKFDDMATWLRDQWAGLFADSLSQKHTTTTINDLASQVEQLSEITESLKSYAEKIISELKPDTSAQIIQEERRRQTNLQIKRFRKEGLISFLEESHDLDPGVMLSEFRSSKNVEEFLKKSGMSDEAIPEFMNKYGNEARADFEKLSKRYAVM